jgi:hypothetical protein
VDTRRLTPVNADAPAGVHSSACVAKIEYKVVS